jgi:hypothetical protein
MHHQCLNLNLLNETTNASTHKAEKLSVKDGLEALVLRVVGSKPFGWRGSIGRLRERTYE